MCLRAGLDGCGKSRPPTGIRVPDLPARSESLYQLSYSGPRERVEGGNNISMELLGLWRDEACKKGFNRIVEFKERRTNIYKLGKGVEMNGSQGGRPIPGLRFPERATDFI